MTTAIQARNGANLSLWNNADVALVKSMVAEKANEDEFRLLIHLANKYQLDPLARQIYCLKYSERKPASIFAGLAGFVAIAERTGKYGGISTTVRREDEPWEVQYTYYENNQRKTGTYKRDYQWVATATVWRTDAAHPFEAQVWESEYSSGRDLWTGKPRTMTTKVAMCQALRLAFSISGLYDQDEIKEAGPAPVSVNPQTGEIIDGTARELPPGPRVVAQEPPQRSEAGASTLSSADAATIRSAVAALGWGAPDCAAYLRQYGVARFGELTAEQAAEVIPDLLSKAAEIDAA